MRKKQKHFPLFLVCLAVLVIVFFTVIIVLSLTSVQFMEHKVAAIQQQKDLLYSQINDYETGKIVPSKSPSADALNLGDNEMMIVRHDGGLTEPIVKMNVYAGHSLARYDNWLYFPEAVAGEKLKGTYYNTVFAYNMDTRERRMVYSAEGLVAERNESFEINDLEIINNKLYFTVGAYTESGALYSMNLPYGAVKKVRTTGGAMFIERYGDKYVLRDGDGDAGCGWGKYYLFDQKTETATKIFDYASCDGDPEYEYLLGLNDQYAIFVHEVIENNEATETVGRPMFVTEIYGIDLNNFTKKVLLKKSMPVNTVGVVLDVAGNRLIINTDKMIYTLDLATDDLDTYLDLTSDQRFDTLRISKVEDTYCANDHYVLDLAAKTFIDTYPSGVTDDQKNEYKCNKFDYYKQSALDPIAALKLPDNFEVLRFSPEKK